MLLTRPTTCSATSTGMYSGTNSSRGIDHAPRMNASSAWNEYDENGLTSTLRWWTVPPVEPRVVEHDQADEAEREGRPAPLGRVVRQRGQPGLVQQRDRHRVERADRQRHQRVLDLVAQLLAVDAPLLLDPPAAEAPLAELPDREEGEPDQREVGRRLAEEGL